MDFYDKLFISVTCVIVAIFAIFNTFCFATDYSFNVIEDRGFIDGFISDYPGADLYYCNLHSGVNYKFTIIKELPVTHIMREASSVDLGTPVKDTIFFAAEYPVGTVLNYTPSDDVICFHSSTINLNDYITVSTSNSMQASIQSLINSLGILFFWDTFIKSLPFVLIVVLVGFGFYIIFKLIRKIAKGKSGNV